MCSRSCSKAPRPGIEDPTERAARVAADNALAERIERDGIAAFVDEWERTPLLALGEHVAEARAPSSAPSACATTRADWPTACAVWAPGSSVRCGRSCLDLGMPVSLLVGERDVRYRALAERMLTFGRTPR